MLGIQINYNLYIREIQISGTINKIAKVRT